MERTTINTAAIVTDMLNVISAVPTNEFIADMQREHRTLQQSFTRLCLMWLETCASSEYRTDLRNEDSHKIAKQMVEQWQQLHKDDRYLKDALPSQMLSFV